MLLICCAVLALATDWRLCAPPIALLGLAFYMLHNTLQTALPRWRPRREAPAVSAFCVLPVHGADAGRVCALDSESSTSGYRPMISSGRRRPGSPGVLVSMAARASLETGRFSIRSIANPPARDSS